MHLASMIEMVESGLDSRQLLTDGSRTISGSELGHLARRGATSLADVDALVYVGENHPWLPVVFFAAALRGVPFVPVNYRLEDEQLNGLVARQANALVVADRHSAPRLNAPNLVVLEDWIAALPIDEQATDFDLDDNDVAVVLYTSGTTSEPKSALLRHRHLMAYLLGSVEFGGAGDQDAVLISVPPYHVAGVANLLSNVFAGRRLVYLQTFDPTSWIDTIRRERVTNAMVVPTMLARIVDALEHDETGLPTLRSLSYGGAKVSESVLRKALTVLGNVDFVNAYGLTETASTIAVLGPDDHRAALTSNDPLVQRRLSSAGRLLPMVEASIRDEVGTVLPAGEAGIIHLRGEQIAGEYATGSLLDGDGWFCTRDHGYLDPDGYLYIEGRIDDTIIRGGENIAPAEIEEVLIAFDGVAEACVVGVPDDEWGQRILAAVVPRAGVQLDSADLKAAVRARLRGSKTPDEIVFREHLPHTDTGKLLRRVVLQDFVDAQAADSEQVGASNRQ